MFDSLNAVRRDLRQWCRDLDPGTYGSADAQAAIAELAAVERLAAGARLRLTACLDTSGDRGDKKVTDWLAEQTGQTPTEAAKDLEAAHRLDGLDATEAALRDGELSVDQVREVTSGAAADPSAETALLDTARTASVHELRRESKRVRSAATDDEKKNRRAHRNRHLSTDTDPQTGEGWLHVKGPMAVIARMLAFLEPFVQAEFARAKAEGRHEGRGAYAFDALLAALAAAGTGQAGAGPTVRIIARVDAAALKRGHTVAGEVCEIEGVGPVPVAALQELLPQAAIDVIVTDGQDVFNHTSFARKPNIAQKIVLHWLGVECQRLGCSATRHLEIDHDIDWAKVKVTELRNLGWLCKPDHRRKTVDGWALVPGRGKRPMVPPDDPRHPKNRPTTETNTQAAA